MKYLFFLCLIPILSFSQPFSQHIFYIPVYPGTELYRDPIDNGSRLQYPFATIFKIFKTTNGDSLNSEEVVKFYQDYFLKKGWKEGIDKREPHEPFLSMMVNVYEHTTQHIQLAGNFYLWIAPKDGMYTVCCEQWRISAGNQQTSDLKNKITKGIKNIALENGFEYQEVFYKTDWEAIYENEFLISRDMMNFRGSKGSSFDVDILTYKDSLVAQEEEKIIVKKSNNVIGTETTLLSENAFLIHQQYTYPNDSDLIVALFSNCIVLLESPSIKDRYNVKDLFNELNCRMNR